MQETRVRSLAWEDPLEEDMATHSGVLAWRIPWTEDRQRSLVGREVTESRSRLTDPTIQKRCGLGLTFGTSHSPKRPGSQVR